MPCPLVSMTWPHQSELVAKVAWGDEPVSVVAESMETLGAARNRLDLALVAGGPVLRVPG